MTSSSWQFLLALLSFSTLLQVVAWGQMEAFIPLFLERDLGVPFEDVPTWTGLLAAAPLLVAAPLSAFWGVLADRYNRKLVLQRTALFGVIGYALAALSQDVWQLLGVRMLMGLTFGVNAVVIAALADVVPQRHIGTAIGVTQMMFPLGKSIGPLMGSALIGLVDLRGMFAVDAVVVLIALITLQVLFHETAARRKMQGGLMGQVGSVFGMVWREKPIRLTFILISLYAGGTWMLTPFFPVIIQRVHQGEDVALAIGLILGGQGAVATIMAPLSGRISDRVGPLRMVIFTMAGLALTSAGLIFASNTAEVALAILLGAIPLGASNTVLYSFLARITPRQHMGSVMGLTPLSRNSAMLFGPLLGAGFAALGLPLVFAAGAAIYGVALGLSLSMKAEGRKQ